MAINWQSNSTQAVVFVAGAGLLWWLQRRQLDRVDAAIGAAQRSLAGRKPTPADSDYDPRADLAGEGPYARTY